MIKNSIGEWKLQQKDFLDIARSIKKNFKEHKSHECIVLQNDLKVALIYDNEHMAMSYITEKGYRLKARIKASVYCGYFTISDIAEDIKRQYV